MLMPSPLFMAVPLKKVRIYTDGACKGNPGPGGYGCVIEQNGKVRELKGGAAATTNNIMELTAAIVALQQLEEPCEVELVSDSQYLVKGMTEWLPGWLSNNWKTAGRQPVKNQDLWRELHRLNQKHRIDWKWIRGHQGHPGNERADFLANQAIAEFNGNTS